MTEPQEQCCGTCEWWIQYQSGKDGWCGLTEKYMLPSEGCSWWEKVYHYEEEDDDEEEDDNDA